MKTWIRIAAVLVLSLALAPLSAHAQQTAAKPGPLTITQVNRTAAQLASAGTPRANRSVALPGDVMRYTLAFRNPQRTAVRPVLMNPIAPGMAYVAGSARSARADAQAEFSIDGGNTFSARPVETVVVDGQRVTRPVAVERYTHVRWTFQQPVSAGQSVAAEFEARLLGSAPSSAAAPSSGR